MYFLYLYVFYVIYILKILSSSVKRRKKSRWMEFIYSKLVSYKIEPKVIGLFLKYRQ